MNISRTTGNFAQRRNLEVTEQLGNIDGTETTQVWIWEADDDMEPLVIYNVNNDGTFALHGYTSLRGKIYQKLTAFLADEKELRGVINHIHQLTK